MYAILISALFDALLWVFQKIVVKFVLYMALYLFVSEAMSYLLSLLPTGDGGLASAFGGLTSGAWYFMDLLQVSVVLPMVLAAYALRFAIRRIPLIG